MTPRPDEDYDVIVHQFRAQDTNGAGRDTWTICLGGEKQSERDSLKAATELACHLATLHSRPAWLLDETRYPLKPIEPATGLAEPARPSVLRRPGQLP